MPNIYDFTVKDLQGNDLTLSKYKDKVVVIVNTASQCGFTPQYKELEEMYQEFKNKGLVILAFPCNQFGSQEPGTEEEIKIFCETHYSISFPMFAKVDVNGNKEAPLFDLLKTKLPGLLGSTAIKWNFTKFLIDRNGVPVKRFSPKDSPRKMISLIDELL
ncbi:MAG: glutathione peroxidase [Bacteriovoracaceae bacterium]|jgi:glutathione peroxidase|nr:glutathione peroxidase [Bacteriovoracaceae bacterium]